MSVRTADTAMPPMEENPIAFRYSLPNPFPNANGNIPRIALNQTRVGGLRDVTIAGTYALSGSPSDNRRRTAPDHLFTCPS